MSDLEANFKDSLRSFNQKNSSSSGFFSTMDNFRKDAVNNLSAAGQGVVSTVKAAVPTKLSEALSDPIAAQTCGMTRFQRTIAFVVLLFVGGGCLALAFFTLPFIVLRPAKFAVSYTVGSVILLLSFSMISGPVTFIKGLLASDRIVFTVTYVGSLGFTLYAALWGQNYFLTIISSIVQMVAMSWYIASFFPGGVTALGYITSFWVITPEQLFHADDTISQITSYMQDGATPVTALATIAELVSVMFTFDVIKTTMADHSNPLVHGLFACLKNNPNASTVQQHICTAIGNLTNTYESSQNWLVSNFDAINRVVHILKQSASLPHVQTQAYYALQKLASRHKSNIQALFHEHSAHELAGASMLAYPSHAPLQTQACILLRRLSYLKETDSTLIAKSCPIVLGAMCAFRFETELVEHACIFINNICGDDQNKRLLVCDPYSVHKVILDMMRLHSGHAAVQTSACRSLSRISGDPSNKKLLVAEPFLAHQDVLEAMRNHPNDPLVQEEACCCLWNLAVNDENMKLLVRHPFLAHEAILAAMRAHLRCAEVQESGCGALWNLMVDEQNRFMLTNEPYLAHLDILTAMQMHSLHEPTQRRACAALANLAVDSDMCQKLVNMQAHVVISAAMRTHPLQENVQQEAVGAIANMSYEQCNCEAFNVMDLLPLCQQAQRRFQNNKQIQEEVTLLETRLEDFVNLSDSKI